jgi:hypothetical protein
MYIFRINQTTWKRIIRRILFDYLPFRYRIFDVIHPYTALPHSGQQMFSQDNIAICTVVPDIFNTQHD